MAGILGFCWVNSFENQHNDYVNSNIMIHRGWKVVAFPEIHSNNFPLFKCHLMNWMAKMGPMVLNAQGMGDRSVECVWMLERFFKSIDENSWHKFHQNCWRLSKISQLWILWQHEVDGKPSKNLRLKQFQSTPRFCLSSWMLLNIQVMLFNKAI